MRRLLIYLPAIVGGFGAGAAAALLATGMVGGTRGFAFNDVSIAGWSSDWSIGSEAADPLTRARVARHGLLALAKEEAVYFTRRVDDAGQALTERCVYRLSGGDQPAEWWSITLYDDQSRLPMNGGTALSIDKTQVGEGLAWSARVAATPPADDTHFLSSQAGGRFDLTLRLYRPSSALIEDPETRLNPPSIARVGCDGEGGG